MIERLTPGVLAALALVALLVVGSYWLARRQRPDARHRSPGSFSPARKSPSARVASSAMSALQLKNMFAPLTALQVIEDGCDEVLRRSRDSYAIAAITAARHSMEKVTRYGD